MKRNTRLVHVVAASVLVACAGGVAAQPVASVMLRELQPVNDEELYDSFQTLDAAGPHAAVRTRIVGIGAEARAIWVFDGEAGAIRYREAVTSVVGHGLDGPGVSVTLDELDWYVSVNSAGQVAYGGVLRVQCDDPGDPACVYDGAVAVFRDDAYLFGELDPLICDAPDYAEAEGVGIAEDGLVYSVLTYRQGLSEVDHVGRGRGAGVEEVICHEDPIADAAWGRIRSGATLHVVKSSGSWYCLNQLRNTPASRNMAAIVDGEVRLREGDVVTFWGDPGRSAALLDIDEIAVNGADRLLWSGQLLTGDDINFDNNDVVGIDNKIILQEGAPVEGVPGALSAYFGRINGGGSARHLAIDDNCNVMWMLICVATFPGDDYPGDPDDTYQQNVSVLMYNGETILATGTPIDQNGDGLIDDDDHDAVYVGDPAGTESDLALSGGGEAWHIAKGSLSLGIRECVFRVTGLPGTTNPWCDDDQPCVGDVDGDGATGQADLGLLLASYALAPGDPFFDPRADLNGDGEVGQTDLGMLLADYGCGP
jgi:hypothetical protein